MYYHGFDVRQWQTINPLIPSLAFYFLFDKIALPGSK